MTNMSKRPKREWRKLDTTAAAEGVWLVKVPNYLSQAWSKSSPDQLLGTLTVGKYVYAVLSSGVCVLIIVLFKQQNI